jgi:glycosyltransferase involved in cell wall biosynthesis
MKILHFIDCLRSGGKERQLVELLKGLSTCKDIIFELAIMSYDIHYSASYDQNIRIHYLIRKNKKDSRIFLKLYNLCKAIKPSIIHTWDSMTSVYAFPIAKILKIRLLNGMIRDAPSNLKPFSRVWIRSKITFPFSNLIISNSYAGLKAYNAPSQKSVCIYNGFDFDRIRNLQKKENVKTRFAINTEKVIGMVASFSNNKDYETYIWVAQMVLKEKENVTFLAIGDGENLEKCKKIVSDRFVDKIKFLGKRNDVESIINIFDIGVLATYTEGLSNAIMEYMALGKPVVATDSGGTKELVVNGKTGFLVKPLDVRDMYIKILQLLENGTLAIKMGEAGRERIYSSFNLEKMSNSFFKLYETIISKNPAI